MIKRMSYTSIAVVLLVCMVSPSFADNNLGIRGGLYTDAEEGFIGGEFLSRVSPRLYFNPNVEYVFTDGASLMTFNGDFHYDFPIASSNYVWAGAGLGISYVNPEGPADSRTDAGLNLLFGIGFPTNDLIPYLQLKVMMGEIDDVVLGFGIRF